MENEIEITNKWKLGKGKNGTFSDINLLVKKGQVTGVKRTENIENKDEKLLQDIESLLKNNWIKVYEKDNVHLEIIIINVGVDDEGRKYATENSINGAMHMALHKIGITPPQIFGL